MRALLMTSLVTSLSHDCKNLVRSTEGKEESGETMVLIHFAVVIAVLAGVDIIFEGDLKGKSGLAIVFVGDVIESTFLYTTRKVKPLVYFFGEKKENLDFSYLGSIHVNGTTRQAT